MSFSISHSNPCTALHRMGCEQFLFFSEFSPPTNQQHEHILPKSTAVPENHLLLCQVNKLDCISFQLSTGMVCQQAPRQEVAPLHQQRGLEGRGQPDGDRRQPRPQRWQHGDSAGRLLPLLLPGTRAGSAGGNGHHPQQHQGGRESGQGR